MKILCYVRADKSVAIGHIRHSLVTLMMGNGYGWEHDRIDYEINKWVNPPAPEIGLSSAIATPYINAIANGGLTEREAIDLIKAKDIPSDCSECHIIEDSDLQTERYFRDAWEWRD
jgi:hypothetical protein